MIHTQTTATTIPPPSELVLRPYQEECIHRTLTAYEQDRHGKETIVLPTGAGKTVIFCQVIGRLAARYGINALIIAHRDELLEQRFAEQDRRRTERSSRTPNRRLQPGA